jgi:hypothetical protein
MDDEGSHKTTIAVGRGNKNTFPAATGPSATSSTGNGPCGQSLLPLSPKDQGGSASKKEKGTATKARASCRTAHNFENTHGVGDKGVRGDSFPRTSR